MSKHKIYHVSGRIDEKRKLAVDCCNYIYDLPDDRNIKDIQVKIGVEYEISPVSLLNKLLDKELDIAVIDGLHTRTSGLTFAECARARAFLDGCVDIASKHLHGAT